MSKQTIAQFLANPNVGSYDEKGNFDCGIWYDWFCKNNALINRGNKLLSKVKAIANSNKFDKDKCYVFFKNNCPVSGPLYDSFSICDIESGDILFWVTAKSGHTGKAEVISFADGCHTLEMDGSWKDVKDYFLK
jgi:hypothetical protein